MTTLRGRPPGRRTPTPAARLFYNLGEVAQMLGVSRSHVYKLVHTGELPSIRLSDSLRVPVAAVDRLVAEAMRTANPAVSGRDADHPVSGLPVVVGQPG